jgi:PPK2 family polyphosphate:nucleotide phosphotransferase
MIDASVSPEGDPVMETRKVIKSSRELSRAYRVDRGKGFKLRQFDPADTGGLKSEDKPRAKDALTAGIKALAELQDRLYAQSRWSVLLIFQAMDAAGKDSAIKHVMSGVNPQGCQVFSFKAPSAEELNHDFLWRTTRCLPERGRIGVFNRSYYEEVLIVQVHPEILANQKLPDGLLTKKLWNHRYDSIRDFERHLARNGTVIRKFYLHVSKEEQLRRFMTRLDDPNKNWKFSSADVRERERWDDYMEAYETLIRETSTEHAPWYVVPADNKWFTRTVVAAAVIDALGELDLAYPKVGKDQMKELEANREELLKTAT